MGPLFVAGLMRKLIGIPWVVPLPRMPVTTRIITFLVGNPYKPSFATVTGRGDNPRYTQHLQLELSRDLLGFELPCNLGGMVIP